MHRRKAVLFATAAFLALGAAGCSGRSADDGTPSEGSHAELVTTTTAATKPLDQATWALYRQVQTLDPIYAFDYPDNTAVSLMCESLQRIQPDGSITDGLASLEYPDETTMVYTINDDATFWDGKPVTPDDVVFSLKREMDSSLGGFYSGAFSRVKDIKATGAKQVTITLTEPDYWLKGELASFAGIVLQKSFTEEAGAKYGTASGGIMCTGAYRFKSWSSGSGVVAEANPSYWNPAVKPLVGEITLVGVPDASALTSALLTGEITGYYSIALATLPQLESSDTVNVFHGQSYNTDTLVVSNLDGVLGDLRVRQALSLALDRKGIISSVYQGAASMPRWFSNPGTFGYAKETFQAAYDDTPEMTQDLDKAKELIQEAGAEGKTLTIGTTNQVSDIAAVTGAYQTAAEAIGLKVKLNSVSADNFINFFIDPKAREGIDAFPSVNYGDYADPAALMATVVLPDGSQNYSGFSDPQITSLMEQARGTADDTERAKLVIQAEKLFNEQLPWIPTVQPNSVLLLNKEATGAVASFAYMFAPWADTLGAS